MSDTNTINIPADGVLKYKGHEAFIGDITPKRLAYLLQYGWAQSLQDSVAGYAKKLKDEGKPDDGGAYTDAEIEAEVKARMAERAADIVAGEVGTRTGAVRLPGIDKIMRDVAREAIKAQVVALNAKGKKLAMPTGEKLAELVEAYIAKNELAVRTEAERRQASVVVDDDMAGLLESAVTE